MPIENSKYTKYILFSVLVIGGQYNTCVKAKVSHNSWHKIEPE